MLVDRFLKICYNIVKVTYSNNARIELTGRSVELEQRLTPITAEMNGKPLRINRETWKRNLETSEEEAALSIDFCRQLAHDDSFRPNSTADCAKVLFKDRKPPRLSKVTKRAIADKDTLLELAHEGISLAGGILDARSDISRRGQLRAWRPYAEYGLVHSKWDSMGCPHGRYTSEGPSLTNRIVPIRETIEPDPGYSFLSFDLRMAEYVVWASLSGDLALGQLFRSGLDFHTEMAQTIRQLVPEWDLRGQELRDAGKTVNFSILYQMTPYTLARKLGCSDETAQRIVAAYYGRAAVASKYIEKVLRAAKRNGYTETFYGRRRYCPDYGNGISERDAHEQEKTLWSHHNAGSAAEYLKWKTVWVFESLREVGFTAADVRLALNIFDQAVWEVKDDFLDDVRSTIEPIWFRKEPGFLKFDAEVKIGKTWGECS